MIHYTKDSINKGYIIGDHRYFKRPHEVMVAWLMSLHPNQVEAVSQIPKHPQFLNTIMANGFMIYMNEMKIDEFTITNDAQSQIVDLVIIGSKKFLYNIKGHAIVDLKKDISIFDRIKNRVPAPKGFLVDTHKEFVV